MGLCGFYQRFVADYATVATPLTDWMQKVAGMGMATRPTARI